MPCQIQQRLWPIATGLLVVLAAGCASRQVDAGAVALDARPRCTGDAELRVVNRTNVLLELVEYDSLTQTTRVISVVDRGVSHFPARGDLNVTYALRGLEATRRGWLTSDRNAEPATSIYTVERRCR